MGLRAYFSNPISCPPALGYGGRGQELYRFLHRMQFPRVCLGGGLRLSRCHVSCGNDDSWVFALIFPLLLISFSLFRRSPLSCASLVFHSLPRFRTLFAHSPLFSLLCRIFSGIFTEVSSFILSLRPLCLYLFGFPSIGATRR